MYAPMLREVRRWLRLGPGFLDARKKILDPERYVVTVDDAVVHAQKVFSTDCVNFVGHSFGGMVALDYALDNPDKVADIISVASAFHGTKGIYWQNVMRLAGLYDERLYDILLPKGCFVKSLKEKIINKWGDFDEHLVHVFNIIAEHDEFVSPSSMSLESLVGSSKALSEISVPEGHCQAAFNVETIRAIGLVVGNGYPTIGLHPVMYDNHFFDDVRNCFDFQQNESFICIDYDYAGINKRT